MSAPIQEITRLKKALNQVEDNIVLTSNKVLDERLHAVSEIRYYQKLLSSFCNKPLSIQMQITEDLMSTLEEIEKWLLE